MIHLVISLFLISITSAQMLDAGTKVTEEAFKSAGSFHTYAPQANAFDLKQAMNKFQLLEKTFKDLNSNAISGNIQNFNPDQIGILLAEDKLSGADISSLKKKHLTKKNLNKLSDDCKLGELDEDKFEDAIEDHFGIKIRHKLFSEEEINLIAGAISSAECSDGKVIKGDFSSGDDSVLGNWDEVEEIALPLEPNTVVSMPNIKALDHFSYYSHLGNTYYYDNDRYIDSDGDGLTDDFEIRNNLDQFGQDTDGDGLTDYEEIVTYQTDANDRDTYPDFDSDLEYVNAINGNDAPTIFYKGEDFN